MTTSTETQFRALRIEIAESDSIKDAGYTLSEFARQFLNVQDTLFVAAWTNNASNMHNFKSYASGLEDAARSYYGAFRVGTVSYNSPLWLSLLTVNSSVVGVLYSFLRMYNKTLDIRNKTLDIRKKRSDVEVHELINEQIMDELRFNHQQKVALRPVLRDPQAELQDLPDDIEAIRLLADAINRASITLQAISRVEIAD